MGVSLWEDRNRSWRKQGGLNSNGKIGTYLGGSKGGSIAMGVSLREDRNRSWRKQGGLNSNGCEPMGR